MAFFPHDTSHFVWALLEGYGVRGGNNKGFALTEDILAPILLACVSVFQGHIAYTLGRHLRRSGKPFLHSRNVFTLVNIVLSAGYIVCTSLVITNLCLKLEFVAGLQRTMIQGDINTASLRICSEDYYSVDTCWSETSRSIRDLTVLIDNFIRGTFQVMVILADGLLIYRCWLFLSSPWCWVVAGSASLFLLISLVVLVVLVLGKIGVNSMIHIIMNRYVSVYSPLLTSLIVSPALLLYLWREQRKLGISLGGRGQLAYRRILRSLLESAIPPLALGLFHPILSFYFSLGSQCYNIVWFTFTVLAPQIIALRVLQARKRPLSQFGGPSEDEHLTTLAFRETQTEATSSSVSGEDHSTRIRSIYLPTEPKPDTQKTDAYV